MQTTFLEKLCIIYDGTVVLIDPLEPISPRFIFRQRLAVAKHDESALCARDTDVETSRIGYETNASGGVVSDGT